MVWSSEPSFRFVIDNFSEKEDALKSQTFVSGGCKWYLKVYPKGYSSLYEDHLSLYLKASEPTPSQTGWKRRTRFYFSLLNKSGKQLDVSSIAYENNVFCAKTKSWGFGDALPLSTLSKFKEDGLLEDDKLVIEVYINIVEVDDGEKKETSDTNGFQAFASQVNSVMRKTFTEHVVKKDYKNALSNACNKVSELAEEGFKIDWLKSKIDEVCSKMKKSEDADRSQIQQLEERIKNLEGFKVHSVEISMEKTKAYDADGSQVQQLEQRIKNLGARLDNLESELEDASEDESDDASSEESDDDYESRLQEIEESLKNLKMPQEIEERLKNLEVMGSDLKMDCSTLKLKLEEVSQLEERIKNLELMGSGFKVDSSYLKSKLEEISMERRKAYAADGSRVQQLEERIKNLELLESGERLDNLESELEDERLDTERLLEIEERLDTLETDDANDFCVQEIEERLENLETMVSDLRDELDSDN